MARCPRWKKCLNLGEVGVHGLDEHGVAAAVDQLSIVPHSLAPKTRCALVLLVSVCVFLYYLYLLRT